MRKEKPTIPVKKNDLVELTIEDFSAAGSGVGHYQGFTIFVPSCAPGDVGSVKILKVQKNYAFGKLLSLTTASPGRIDSDCPVDHACGGCCFRHIDYETELLYKEKRVRDTLERIGGLDLAACSFDPITGSAQRNRYRNKCLLPIGRSPCGTVEMGFYAPHSHRIVDCPDCLLAPLPFAAFIRITRQFLEAHQISIYSEENHSGLVRRLYLREAQFTGENMVCLVINGKQLPKADLWVRALLESGLPITSILLNHNTKETNVALGDQTTTLYGSPAIEDRLCGLRFSISPLSFYQVNPPQAQRLYEKAAEYAALTPSDILLDLYCGTGTIGLSMASRVKALIGVELIPDAVADAQKNARRNGIENARFYCANASDFQQSHPEIAPSVVIIDPPRKGCEPAVIDCITRYQPRRVVYISCDPATLARDLRLFAKEKYQPSAVAAYDLFPGTAHVETCVLLTREGSCEGHGTAVWD